MALDYSRPLFSSVRIQKVMSRRAMTVMTPMRRSIRRPLSSVTASTITARLRLTPPMGLQAMRPTTTSMATSSVPSMMAAGMARWQSLVGIVMMPTAALHQPHLGTATMIAMVMVISRCRSLNVCLRMATFAIVPTATTPMHRSILARQRSATVFTTTAWILRTAPLLHLRAKQMTIPMAT